MAFVFNGNNAQIVNEQTQLLAFIDQGKEIIWMDNAEEVAAFLNGEKPVEDKIWKFNGYYVSLESLKTNEQIQEELKQEPGKRIIIDSPYYFRGNGFYTEIDGNHHYAWYDPKRFAKDCKKKEQSKAQYLKNPNNCNRKLNALAADIADEISNQLLGYNCQRHYCKKLNGFERLFPLYAVAKKLKIKFTKNGIQRLTEFKPILKIWSKGNDNEKQFVKMYKAIMKQYNKHEKEQKKPAQ